MKRAPAGRLTKTSQTWSKIKPRLAFTLAEVLITLGIIGMVADLTIPNLVKNFQKQQYVIGLKKAYTGFNQALMQLSADMGCPGDLQCTGLFKATANPINISASSQNFGQELVKYFKVIKTCNTTAAGPENPGCWPSEMYYNYDKSGGRLGNPDTTTTYRFITADGMLYKIKIWNDNCNANRSFTGNGSMTQVCGQFLVDVNGFKPPNVEGRDIFRFYITNGKGPLLYPFGGSDDTDNAEPHADSFYWKTINACTPNDPTGRFCSGRIMDEGWQMNY